jgi:2-polyprenyl-3-methyl-5-hydroxy-6-metoxy-1,4-benzoquinol methylase
MTVAGPGIDGGERGCPLCGGAFAPSFALGSSRLGYCRRCELGRLIPLPSEDELSALYESATYFSGSDDVGYAAYEADAPQRVRTFRAKLALLLRHGPVHALLDVGCGPGYLLLEAQRAGIRRAVGVDRNPRAVEHARRLGVEAHVGLINALPREPVFDAVAMLDLLEHVTDPLSFLEEVRARLRPGARVLIMTPNVRSILARVSGSRWVSFKVPEHVYYYSPRSLAALLRRTGFEVVTMRPSHQYATVAFGLDRLGRIAPRLARIANVVVRACRLHGGVVPVPNGCMDAVARVSIGHRQDVVDSG